MTNTSLHDFLRAVIAHMPSDWLALTTHRLDIYNESLAKTEFISEFEKLYETRSVDNAALAALPTAYDYIRLGHPLSSVLEWTIAKMVHLASEHVISFGSEVTSILAVLRKNALEQKATHIYYTGTTPIGFETNLLNEVYDYSFTLTQVTHPSEIPAGTDTTIFIAQEEMVGNQALLPAIDFYVHTLANAGSIILVNGNHNKEYISEIQHVRRRETIAMTPVNVLALLKSLTQESALTIEKRNPATKKQVADILKAITNTSTTPLAASSGLSMQYAIMMGLVHDARIQHPGKAIKFIVPPNCYGGTNDQARRVAACLDDVAVVDLPVDAGNDMVQSLNTILTRLAHEDAIPYIIAEIPTNPRVEVPNLDQLKAVLSEARTTAADTSAVDPVFILDQTFCPNVHFLGDHDILGSVRAIAYASGSKFPSGGTCTAGYCVANTKSAPLMENIRKHLELCDNEATALQYDLLATYLPSMNDRIQTAYENTRAFVTFIEQTLPEAKINFVSEELAQQGFTPSVFSLDLPTQGNTDAEKEAYKRALNLKLINAMITEIPNESKYCVSYGQLKGCYWTIPATSTQGTTKEGDKDYIVRAALSGAMDLEHHKDVFKTFVDSL